MTIVYCISCAEEIDTDINPVTPVGHLCHDCAYDYTIMKGGYKDAYV